MKKLPFSILKNNKLFSVSLLTIYVIVSIIFVIITFFYSSVTTSIKSFIYKYGISDATVLTSASPNQLCEQLEEIDGVCVAHGIMMVEGKTTLESGDVFAIRYSSISESNSSDKSYKFYNVETKMDVVLDDESVLVSSKFASKNNVGPGDTLTVNMSGQKISLTVTDIVSCPETIYVARDVNSWFDDTQYAFVYVGESIMQESFGLQGLVNRFDIWFEEGANENDVLSEIDEKLTSSGITVVSKTLLEDSTVYYQIHSAVDGTKAVLTYLPVIIFIIGILFCSFFINQIIISSQKTVGILKALGARDGQICMVFVVYNIILCTSAIIIGGLLGFGALRLLLHIYEETFALPSVVFECDAYMIPIAVVAVYAIGILSCIICVGQISKYDPAVIVSGQAQKKIYNVPRFVEKTHLNAYAKISLSSILRNKRRTAVMCLCNIVCLLLTFMSVAVLESKIAGMDFAFDERFGYDYVVISDDKESMEEVAAMKEVADAEYAATFVFEYEDEFMRIEALDAGSELTAIVSADGGNISAPQDGIILEEGFARRHNLDVGDQVKVGDVNFEVKDISREYFYSTQYISMESAQLLGAENPNVLYVSLKNPDSESFKSQLADMDGIICFYSVVTRQEAAVTSMSAMDAPCYLFVLLGILIGAIIVSNMNIISIQRRKKEFATLTVLGSSGKQFNGMLIFDMLVQFVISIAIGIPLGCIVSRVVLRGMSSISMEYVLVNIPVIALVSCVAVLVYQALSLFFAKRAINHLNYVEILARR